MTKTELQKELLEKVKPGKKPSDIKKQRQKEVKKSISPSPIAEYKEKDEGYENDKSISNKSEQSEQIKTLQRQLTLYKEFKEADLKIKEKYKEEIKELKRTIKELQENNENKKLNMVKEKPKEIKKEVKPEKETLIKSQEGVERSRRTLDFFCEMCEEKKIKQHLNLRKLNSGLGMDLTKLYKMCDDCVSSGRWDIKTERDKGDDPLNW